ncbi:MAG: hypothetical protein WAL85_05010, partial [Candidatus Korobacteraceae bacterium]
MAHRSLVIIDELDINGVWTGKAKNNTPIGRHRYRPKSFQLTLQLMETISREIQGLRRSCGVKDRQDSFNTLQQIGADAATVPLLIESLQAAMLEASDHRSDCKVTSVGCQSWHRPRRPKTTLVRSHFQYHRHDQ